jgi:sulfite exporter TauE/SafE
MIGFLVILLGLLTGLVGAIGSAFGLPIHGATGILLIFGGVVLVIVGLVMVSMSFYRRTTADIAFVRTGMGGSRVVLDEAWGQSKRPKCPYNPRQPAC